MSYNKWTSDNIASQKDQIILITGASSGLGKEATRVLAAKGAHIVMAVRNTKKGTAVVQEIKKELPQAKIDVRHLDLSALKSVRSFSTEFMKEYNKLDVLINNAGIMMCPFSKTADGFEIQMGTNHLGHFALTGHLMSHLKKTKDSRIVATASIAHKQGNIDFTDINWEKRTYKTAKAYSDSKLANIYFAYELARKLKDQKDAPLVTISHPGWTKTELDRHSGIAAFMGNIIAQTPEMGTLPTLLAATEKDLLPGDYIGPKGMFEMRGYPVKVQSNKLSHDVEKAKKLWKISEELTGVTY